MEYAIVPIQKCFKGMSKSLVQAHPDLQGQKNPGIVHWF